MFRGMIQRFAVSMARFMYGRYGVDELTKALTLTAFVLYILGMFIPFVGLIGFVLLCWSIFRTYSRNIEKRRIERERYLRRTDGIRKWFRLRRRMFKERKTHCYFRCKTCKAVIRVPKGRGEINVGCPKCQTRTTRYT